LVAWRRFLVESVVCGVLIGWIVHVAVGGSGGVLVGPFVMSVAFAIVAIVRHER
jgi:ABC-type Co2+ transport system permease subunit